MSGQKKGSEETYQEGNLHHSRTVGFVSAYVLSAVLVGANMVATEEVGSARKPARFRACGCTLIAFNDGRCS